MSDGAAPRAWLRLAPLALVALILAAYAPTWDAEFVVWDDDDHIYENRHIIAEDGYWEAWRDWRDPAFYPITFSSWYAEWRLSNGAPWLFHIDNVLLHVANALLLGALLQALGLRGGLSWAIAGVWALHPQQVASVAWLTERKNLLYALFYLASMLVYARSVPRAGAAGTRAWVMALLLALAALSSKATAVTLPIAIALTHWVCGGKLDRRAGLRIGAFFAVSIAVGLLHVSREEVTPLLPFGTRMFVAARAAWFYVGKFLWPIDLVAVYPRWVLAHAPLWGGAAFAALGGTAAIAAWQAHRIPPIAWLGVGMYSANIALVVGVVWFPFMGYSFVSDHLLYVAAVGLALVFGLSANAVLEATGAPGSIRVALAGGLCCLLAVLTWQQTAMWENTEALWTRTLEVNPQSRLAHKNLGVYLLEESRPDEARTHFQATLALEPNDVEALLNMGVLASDRGDWDEAVRYYSATLEAGAYSSLALGNLGVAAAKTGSLDVAIRYYERALEHDAGDARTRTNLGAARAESGDLEGAIADYEESLRMNPQSDRTHYNLAVALYASGRVADAADHYERAQRLAPDDVDTLYNLGVARMDLGQYDEAADAFRQLLAIEEGHAEAAHNLGTVLLASDDLDAAEGAFAQAHEAAPTDPDTAGVLASLRYRRQDVGGAIEVLERALAATPDHAPLANQLAWIRATCPIMEWRKPAAAIGLAERAVTNGGAVPAYLDTLAAALAAAGRFEEAEATQERSVEATPPGDPRLAERERRHRSYLPQEGPPTQ